MARNIHAQEKGIAVLEKKHKTKISDPSAVAVLQAGTQHLKFWGSLMNGFRMDLPHAACSLPAFGLSFGK